MVSPSMAVGGMVALLLEVPPVALEPYQFNDPPADGVAVSELATVD